MDASSNRRFSHTPMISSFSFDYFYFGSCPVKILIMRTNTYLQPAADYGWCMHICNDDHDDVVLQYCKWNWSSFQTCIRKLIRDWVHSRQFENTSCHTSSTILWFEISHPHSHPPTHTQMRVTIWRNQEGGYCSIPPTKYRTRIRCWKGEDLRRGNTFHGRRWAPVVSGWTKSRLKFWRKRTTN